MINKLKRLLSKIISKIPILREHVYIPVYVRYNVEEHVIVDDCKQRLKALGVEEIEIDGLCVRYWKEITEAFEFMENTFPCLKGYVKRLEFYTDLGQSFMKAELPLPTDPEDSDSYKYLITPTISINKFHLDENFTEKSYIDDVKTEYRKVYGVYGTIIHELSHILDSVIVIMTNHYDFYDKSLTEDILYDRAKLFSLSYQDGTIHEVLKAMNEKTVKQVKAECKKKGIQEKTPEYYSYVNTILKGYKYAFNNEHEFFAEMISTYFMFGENADNFVKEYYDVFYKEYSWVFNILFEDYKQANDKRVFMLQIKKSLS